MRTRTLSRCVLVAVAILLGMPLAAQAQKVLQVGVIRDPVNSRYATVPFVKYQMVVGMTDRVTGYEPHPLFFWSQVWNNVDLK